MANSKTQSKAVGSKPSAPRAPQTPKPAPASEPVAEPTDTVEAAPPVIHDHDEEW